MDSELDPVILGRRWEEERKAEIAWKKLLKLWKKQLTRRERNMGIFLEKQDHSMKVPIEHEFEFVRRT